MITFELTQQPLYILFFGFTTPFDRIWHTYLLRISMSYDYSIKFIGLTKAINDNAFSSVQIHGCVAGHVPVECFIRQGCPMNMLLFTLALNLLIVCWIDILQALQWDISHRKQQKWHTQTTSRPLWRPKRIFQNKRTTFDLRTGKVSSTEHPQVQSFGDSFVGHIGEHSGHPPTIRK